MRQVRRLLPFVLVFSLTANALSWNDTGHMVIAAIAYQHLTPKAKRAADALLRNGDQWSDFLTAACWADDTKSRDTGRWHYVDQYFREDGQATELKPDAENVVWAINKFSLILGDRARTKVERSEALKYLIHFVGDVHQPLHCVSRVSNALPAGDRGGNLFKIKAPKGIVYKPRNLHSLWDVGGGLFDDRFDRSKELSSDSLAPIYQVEKQLDQRFGAAASRNAKNLNPVDWAAEGLKLARASAYPAYDDARIPDAFVESVHELSSKRATTAGYRLAALLNKLLG